MRYAWLAIIIFWTRLCRLTLGFSVHVRFVSKQQYSVRSCTYLQAEKEENNKNKKGYQFGDFTKGILKKAVSNINQVTGKEQYEFGDLSRWLDERAKQRVSNLTGKDDYQFGDLSQWADSVARERVSNFTKQDDYQFGDITKELLRRILAGEYDTRDVWLAMRVLVSAGATLTPLASALPIKWLLDLINLGIAEDLGARLLQTLAKSLDERMKEVLTGDKKYQLGDVSKKKLQQALKSFTGKDSYQVGDISKQILKLKEDSNNSGNKRRQERITIDTDAITELEDWDTRFQARQQEA